MIELTKAQFDIVKAISQGNNSASSAAKKADLSLPYTLSQMQLLEAHGVIGITKKQRQKGPGKPKKEFAVEKSSLKVELISKHLVEKKEFSDSIFQNYMKLILSMPAKKQHAISEYYWVHLKDIREVIAFGFIENSEKKVELLAFTTEKHLHHLRTNISNFTSSEGIVVACWIHTIEEFIDGVNRQDFYYEEIKSKIKPVVDPEGLFKEVYNE